MKRWMISVLCAAVVLFSACGADPDLILQNDVSVSDEDFSGEDSGTDGPEGNSSDGESAETALGESSDASEICVYICGAVNNPGVYELEEGDRIYQLVEMAGGLSVNADEQSVNLAQTVGDGEMVYIPTVEEAAAGAQTYASAADDSMSGSSDNVTDDKVNINTATAAELTVLNGIGDAKAAAIVTYREEHGFFQSIEEIMQVDGIAEATYNKIKDQITV